MYLYRMYGLTNNYIVSKNTINWIYLFLTWNGNGNLEMFTFKSYVNERSSTGTLSYDADASCPTNLTSKLDFIAGRLYQNGPAYTDPPCLVWNIIHRVQLTKLARIVALDNFVVSFNWERRCKQEAMKNYWSKYGLCHDSYLYEVQNETLHEYFINDSI